MGTVFVGIAGGSGSGKTTVARALGERFGPTELRVLPLDAYYRDHQDLSPEARAGINYDCPAAFDEPLLLEQLQALRAGRGVDQPLYDYATHSRRVETVELPPTPVVILEGILVLALPAIRPLLDLKLYVETAPDLRFLRRVRRDMEMRGRSFDSVVAQYLETVRPMHFDHIEPSRQHADLIVPGEGPVDAALDLVGAWCAQRVAEARVPA